MTVSTTTRSVRHIGNGVATSFPFTFKITTIAETVVIVETISTGLRTTLTSSQYSISGLDDDAGGSVTYPLTGGPIDSDTAIIVAREVDYTQDMDITNQSGFFPQVLEDQLDDVVFQIQQIADETSRAVKAPVGDATAGLTLPTRDSRAGKSLQFDANGDLVVGDIDFSVISASYDTKAAVEAIALEASVNWVLVAGYLAAGDGGGGLYKRVASEPSHVGKVQSADGAWWELVPEPGGNSVEQFGARGLRDGTLADSTAAIQSAIDWASAHERLSRDGETSLVKYGYPQLLLADFYKITGGLTFPLAQGLLVSGNGRRSSGLILVSATATALLSPIAYNDCTLRDLSLIAADTLTSGADGKPDIALQTAGSRTHYGLNLDGTGGGTRFVVDNVDVIGFARPFRTMIATGNDDMMTCLNVGCFHNDQVWENSNTQAVKWVWENCSMLYNGWVEGGVSKGGCFKNPGMYMIVRGGSYINPGHFIEHDGTPSLVGSFLIDGVKFENYQNIDPTSNPKWLKLAATGTITGTFRHCSSSVGTAYGKVSMDLTGIFRLLIDDSDLDGEWEVNANSAPGGILSSLTFRDCRSVPTITQTLAANTGTVPINLTVERSAPNSVNSEQINRRFVAVTNTGTKPGSVAPMTDATKFGGLLNTESKGKDIEVWCPTSYELAVTGARLTFEHNTTVAVTATLWRDDTKTTKVVEWIGIGTASRVPTLHAAATADLTTVPIMSSASKPLYFELTTAGNAGFVMAWLEIDLMQVGVTTVATTITV